MNAHLHPVRQEDGRRVYSVRADVVDESLAGLDIKGHGGFVALFFENLEQIAAFGRAIEREAEVCMAERDAQAEEVA